MENSPTSNSTANQAANDRQSNRNSFVLPSRFRVRLEMFSDWHVGTGAGRPGSVDKLLARDADGFPFVPAKTINGIWRDAMETLTLALDGSSEANWSKWVEAIFGIQPNQIDAKELDKRLEQNEATYNYSLLSLQPARLSRSLRTRIDKAVDAILDKEERRRQRQKLLCALTFIKPGVEIDRETGTARTDFLRFEEMGRAGTVLEAECELNEVNENISALLLLSAKLVERIGGKRRRGAGLCALKICDESGKEFHTKYAIDWLDNNRAATNAPQSPRNAEIFSLYKQGNESEWQTLEFSLKLQTPVSIVVATLGNVSESLDYIPGTYLLPHFTKKLGKQIFQAVAYGDLQILPATVAINGSRGLPVPRVFAQQKDDGGFDRKGDGDKNAIYNKLKDIIGDQTPQLKAFRGGYVQALDSVTEIMNDIGKLPSYKTVPKTLLMHNTVEDKYQRPTEDVGGIYSREAIAAGTTLLGQIKLRKALAEQLGADWWNNVSGAVRLGASRKDDYGLAELNVEPPKAFSSSSKLDAKRNRLTLCLLSDCLLRNSNLRQTNLVETLAEELSRKENLNATLKPIKPSDRETTSLVMARRIESWNERWGFPRPTLIAMEAGSCVVFEVDEELTEATLHRVEAAGIGERRAEGYGQARFNPPLLTNPINSWEPADPPKEIISNTNSQGLALTEEDTEFAEFIEETAWREELRLAVLKIADNLQYRKHIFGFDSESGTSGTPPMSQIGGLRSAISRLNQLTDTAMVIGWLDHLKATENRRKKWSEDKKKAEGKIKRIRDLITEECKVWSILDEAKVEGISVWSTPPALVRTKQELQNILWPEAVRALFDACARAHKREVEKKETKQDGSSN